MRQRPYAIMPVFAACTVSLLILSGVSPLTSWASRRAEMLVLDAAAIGQTVGRNPAIISGTVLDPLVREVFINRVGAPVMVLGRLRRDLPGVPFQVRDGRFTGYASFLGAGVNTVRVIAMDGKGERHVAETEILYDPSTSTRADLVAVIRGDNLREAFGVPIDVPVVLRNRTNTKKSGSLRLNVTQPDGASAVVAEFAYAVDSGQPQTQKVSIPTDKYALPGVYLVSASVVAAEGTASSEATSYFELYHPGNYPFVDVTAQAGLRTLHGGGLDGAGASWGDYNNDGNYDLFLSNLQGPASLYRGNPDGTFTDVTRAVGLAANKGIAMGTRSGSWGDYDNDGYADLFVTSALYPCRLFHNNKDGTFRDVTARAGVDAAINSYQSAWGDYDSDGLLDLYVAGNLDLPLTPDFQVSGFRNQLYHNNGDGTFAELGNAYGVDDAGPTLSVQWLDYDYDGDVDLFVVNDFSAFTTYPSTVYRNDGPDGKGGWKFADVGAMNGVHDVPLFGMGLAMADYDGDGDQDFFMTNIGIPVLFRNENGHFVDATFAAGVGSGHPAGGPYADPGNPSRFPGDGWLNNTWGAQFWDYDLDGWPDLYVAASGMDYESFPIAPFNPNWLFHNNRDGTFTETGAALGLNHPGRTRGIAMADYDQDGDLDLYLANNDQYGTLLRNDFKTDNQWIKIRLQGTLSNRDAIGSRITIQAGGRTQIRLYPDSDPASSQPWPDQVFGLGPTSIVDSITIHWPRGLVQTLTNIDLSSLDKAHRLLIVEPGT